MVTYGYCVGQQVRSTTNRGLCDKGFMDFFKMANEPKCLFMLPFLHDVELNYLSAKESCKFFG